MPLYNARLPALDPAEVRRYAGLRNAAFPDELLRAACSEAKVLARPQTAWETYAYDPEAAAVAAAPALALTGESIRKHLRRCRAVVILAATVGDSIEAEISAQFAQGNYTQALLLDAAATTAVETAIDQLEAALRQRFQKEGLRLCQRFSPGYGDWDIRVQPRMLVLAQAERIGVSLTESCMLTPRKSVTALIGLTQEAPRIEARACRDCNLTDCPARKEKETN